MQDLNGTTVTDAVLGTFEGTPDPRLREILLSLTRHLHAFVHEIEPSEDEWERAVAFLVRAGKMSDHVRHELILLSDTLGVTMLVDAINHRFPSGATENSVLGPFFVEARPEAEAGADISGGIAGEPLVFEGRVLSHTAGAPIAGAEVDVWHSDADGHYDVMRPGLGGLAMRALFRTDRDGRFWFRLIMPTSYPIPDDGPVGDLLRASRRSPMRPAHVHVRIAAPGHERLTTMIFLADDPHLDSDPVFGVKRSLIAEFEHRPGGSRLPDGSSAGSSFRHYAGEFRLAPAGPPAA